MGKSTDVRTVGATLYFLPVRMRLPLKLGKEGLTHVTSARVSLTVADAKGKTAEGWGETPLNVQSVWLSLVAYEERHEALKEFSSELTDLWASVQLPGHPIEIGQNFQDTVLPGWLTGFNQRRRRGKEPLPWLAALSCCSPFDLALHDAYGQLLARPTYETYHSEFMTRDLAQFLQPAENSKVSFQGKYPSDLLAKAPAQDLPAWHLVGDLDPLDESELTGDEPRDGYPVLLPDWIRRDGLRCLKINLRGNDAQWDYDRLVKIGRIAVANEVDWLSTNFNCDVPDYLNQILDRVRDEQPRIYGMILYVNQPFPYELEKRPVDLHSVSGRKPLFLDDSAHDWGKLKLARELGWSGVALKTSCTQTGAIIRACWARAHGMGLMVHDLINPMLAQFPHVLLAAHSATIMGVVTTSDQFCPDASMAEAEVHPDLFQRRGGKVSLSSVRGPGFGYRLAEIKRNLPAPAARCEA